MESDETEHFLKSDSELEVVCHLSIDLGPGTGHFVVASDPVVYSFSRLVPVDLQTRQSVIIMSSVASNLKKCTALKYADIWSDPSLHHTNRTLMRKGSDIHLSQPC